MVRSVLWLSELVGSPWWLSELGRSVWWLSELGRSVWWLSELGRSVWWLSEQAEKYTVMYFTEVQIQYKSLRGRVNNFTINYLLHIKCLILLVVQSITAKLDIQVLYGKYYLCNKS